MLGERLQHRKSYVPVLLLVVVLLTIVEATLLFPRTHVLNVSAVETTNSVGVYWNTSCEDRVYSLDWGNLYPGATQNIDLYVRNEGNKAVVLDLITENWLPLIAEQNISLSWNYQGHPIYKNQVTVIDLELSVSPEIEGVTSFSFDIVIDHKKYALGEVAEEKILNAPVNTVYFIYTDPSCQSCAEATYDGTAGETVRNLCADTQHYGFNTTKYWLLPLGAINTTTIHNATIAMFGGRCPNVAVAYYETVRELTPVKCKFDSDYIWFENRTGTNLGAIPMSVIEAPKYHEDMFTAMVFYDEEGDNTFFLMYGFGWKGTWASGIYFKEVISKNLSAYTNEYYIFHWIDDNAQDGIPQSSEIHQEVFE